MNEGYIKYDCIWTKCKIEVSDSIVEELNEIRSKLVIMGMIGKIPEGPGFGNISIRKSTHEYYITGTNTGHLDKLKLEHLSLISQAKIDKNKVWCSGLSQASSESLSHAAIYQLFESVNAVIHVHHSQMWKYYLNILPTTSWKVAYGTPEMALEIKEKIRVTPLRKALVLAGHEDGLIVFGMSLEEAFKEIENLFQSIN